MPTEKYRHADSLPAVPADCPISVVGRLA